MQPRWGAAFYVCFIASKILQVSDTHITPSNKDMFHYDRFIVQDEEKFTKMIYGIKSEEIFKEAMSEVEDYYDFIKEVNNMGNESKETKYSVKQAIYILRAYTGCTKRIVSTNWLQKWNDALRECMKVLISTKERPQTISDYIEYGKYLLSDM